MRKRKTKPKKVYRVYCTYYPNGDYYIGFSSKPDNLFEKYFGSNKQILELIKENPDNHGLRKEVVAVFQKQSHAKAVEHMLQWENRLDEKCLNQMWNVRLRLDHLKDLEMPDWKPTS